VKNTRTMEASRSWSRKSLLAIVVAAGLVAAGSTAASAAQPITSASSGVQAATAAPTTLFGADKPAVASAKTDNDAVELGVAFTTSTPGSVTGIKFYKGAGNTGTHVGQLWTSDGKSLAKVTFTNETASGWQTAKLSTPVALKADTRYVVSYLAPKGNYSYTSGYFASAKKSGSLTAAASKNGLFRYGSGGGFPSSSFKSTNYFVDVDFTAAPVTTPTPPTTTPAPSPTPAPSAAPAPAPSPAPTTAPTGWPNASNTGVPAGTTLTKSGALNITTPGTVVNGADISGGVQIRAANVTIKNSKVTGRIEVFKGSTNALIQRVEIVGPGTSSPDSDRPGIASYDYTCDGCNIHGWGKGAYIDQNVVIKNSWIHDLPVYGDPGNGGSHNEPILAIGSKNFTITGNRLDAGTQGNFSAALAIYSQGSQTQNGLVQGNLLNGGGYCLYAGSDTDIKASNVRIIGNTFGTELRPKCGGYGAATAYYNGNGNQWSGNVWQNGTVVPAP
jgi:hypothetical protein